MTIRKASEMTPRDIGRVVTITHDSGMICAGTLAGLRHMPSALMESDAYWLAHQEGNGYVINPSTLVEFHD